MMVCPYSDELRACEPWRKSITECPEEFGKDLVDVSRVSYNGSEARVYTPLYTLWSCCKETMLVITVMRSEAVLSTLVVP